jgi:hypothetical protein
MHSTTSTCERLKSSNSLGSRAAAAVKVHGGGGQPSPVPGLDFLYGHLHSEEEYLPTSMQYCAHFNWHERVFHLQMYAAFRVLPIFLAP